MTTFQLQLTRTETADSVPAVPNEWAILGGVRFMLAVFVAYSHTNSVIPNAWRAPSGYDVEPFGAFQAVIGFFAISGYSIAASIARSEQGFLARRFFRVIPTFYIGLILTLFGLWMNNLLSFIHPIDLALNALCLQFVFTPSLFLFSQTWSITAEFAYYLLTPLFMRVSPKALLVVAAISIVMYLSHPIWSTTPFHRELHGISILSLAWIWLAGFLYYRYRTLPYADALFLFSVIGVAGINPQEDAIFSSVVLCLSAMAIVGGRKISLTIRQNQILTYLGELSYPLYIVEYASYLILNCLTGNSPFWTARPIYVLYATLVAMLVYHLVDKPIRKWSRRRFSDNDQRTMTIRKAA